MAIKQVFTFRPECFCFDRKDEGKYFRMEKSNIYALIFDGSLWMENYVRKSIAGANENL